MAKKETQIGSLMDTKSREPVMSFIQPDAKDSLTIGLAGDWKIGEEIPSPDDAIEQIESARIKQIGFDTKQFGAWDSGLLTFLIKIIGLCEKKDIAVDKRDSRRVSGNSFTLPRQYRRGRGPEERMIRSLPLNVSGRRRLTSGILLLIW